MSTTHPSATTLPRLREVALFCLPALLLGLALRIVLTSHMPLAFFTTDTNEFLGDELIGGSRTFLPKLIYGIPMRLNLPLLRFIAVLQHFFGVLLILASGMLAAQWLRTWRIWIIPFTCLIALQPTLLWYEHFALPDSTFALAIVLACLAGGKFYRERNLSSAVLLAMALIFLAGIRQEGFIFVFFGVALIVRVYWGDWRKLRVALPIALILALVVVKLTKTNQGGYMLLTSLIQWAPDRLWSEPNLSPRVVQLRDSFREQWPAFPDRHNHCRKIIVAQVQDYLVTERNVRPKKRLNSEVDALCKRLSIEIAVRNFWRLPGLAFNKFRAMHREPPSPDFGREWAHEKHLDILFGKRDNDPPKEHDLIKLYLERDFSSREELANELPRLYRILPDDWLSRFQRQFYALEYGGTLLPTVAVGPQTLPGLPLLYLFTAAGFLLVFIREGRALSDKQLWLLMLLLQAFAVGLSASLRSRYRLSFEPWFLLGVFCLLDSVVGLVRASWSRNAGKKSPDTEPLTAQE